MPTVKTVKKVKSARRSKRTCIETSRRFLRSLSKLEKQINCNFLVKTNNVILYFWFISFNSGHNIFVSINGVRNAKSLERLPSSSFSYHLFPKLFTFCFSATPGHCESDEDCLKGTGICIQRECHCRHHYDYGDGKTFCESKYKNVFNKAINLNFCLNNTELKLSSLESRTNQKSKQLPEPGAGETQVFIV